MTDTKLSFGRIQTGMTCMRKAQLQHEHGISRDSDNVSMRIGSAVHVGIDMYSKGATTEDAIISACAAIGSEIERQYVGVMLAGYFWRWANFGAEVIASDLEFELPIYNPETGGKTRIHTLHDKIDRIVKLADGRIAVMETRTTSEEIEAKDGEPPVYWKRLIMDTQSSISLMAARQLGYDAHIVLYDVLRRPTLKPKMLPMNITRCLVETGAYVDSDGVVISEGHAVEFLDNGARVEIDGVPTEIEHKKTYFQLCETPHMMGRRVLRDMQLRYDHYFQRREVPRLDSDLADAQREIFEMDRIFHFCRSNDYWPRNTASCVGFGTCSMFNLCSAGYKPGEALPEGFHFNDSKEIQ